MWSWCHTVLTAGGCRCRLMRFFSQFFTPLCWWVERCVLNSCTSSEKHDSVSVLLSEICWPCGIPGRLFKEIKFEIYIFDIVLILSNLSHKASVLSSSSVHQWFLKSGNYQVLYWLWIYFYKINFTGHMGIKKCTSCSSSIALLKKLTENSAMFYVV